MSGERRQHHRLNLHLPVILLRPNATFDVCGETVNISTHGFYCTTKQPFAPGEILSCRISIPNHAPVADVDLSIDAEVEVVRITATESQLGFGIGCRIRTYRISTVDEGRK